MHKTFVRESANRGTKRSAKFKHLFGPPFGAKTFSLHFFIFSRMGIICSKAGLFPGSSFIQILINLAMWLEIPGEISGRRPSVAI